MEFRRKLLHSVFVGACGVAMLVGARPPDALAGSDTSEQPAVILAQVPMMLDVDLPGFDFATFDLPSPDPRYCEDACSRDARCVAWTYVKPYTTQGPAPRCWLKAGVPRAQRNTCCVSGIKQLRR